MMIIGAVQNKQNDKIILKSQITPLGDFFFALSHVRACVCVCVCLYDYMGLL